MATAINTEELRTFNRELPVPLNDHELQQYGKMLAEKVREEELAEEKKKQVNAEHSNRIKGIRVEIKRIADARAKGEELRPVKCIERLANGVIQIVRTDTNAVVDVRPADMRDLQVTIPGVDDEGVEPANDEVGPPGEMTTSSMGDQVFVSSPDEEDELEADAIGQANGDATVDEDDEHGLVHIEEQTTASDDGEEIDTDPFVDGAEATSGSPKPRAQKPRGKPGTSAKAAKKTSAPKKTAKKRK